MGTSTSVELPASPGQCKPGQRSGPNILPELQAEIRAIRARRVGETEPSFVSKDADINVSGEAPDDREAEWYRVSQALVSVQ